MTSDAHPPSIRPQRAPRPAPASRATGVDARPSEQPDQPASVPAEPRADTADARKAGTSGSTVPTTGIPPTRAPVLPAPSASVADAPLRARPAPQQAAAPPVDAHPTAAAPHGPARTSVPAATRPPAPAAPAAAGAVAVGPRRVRLAVSRVNPWSVMKLSFLLSVAAGVMIVIAAVIIWLTLDGLGVFGTINDLANTALGAESQVSIMDYVGFSRVVSGATLVAVVDVFLLTALSTIGAFLYNLTASLVGGLDMSLTDE